MTYPPQDGSGYPQHQQPQGFYGQGGYPPPGYPPHGGYHPGPPRKSKTGLWVGLVIAFIAIIAVVITGFVAPGFFLGKDDENAGENNPQGNNPPASAAHTIAAQAVDAINTRRTGDLNDLLCAGALQQVLPSVTEVIRLNAQLRLGTAEPDPKNPGRTLFNLDNDVNPGLMSIDDQGGTFCVSRVVLSPKA